MSPATRWTLVALALVLALAAPARPAAAEVFLRLFTESGAEIQGDVIAAVEPNAIEVHSVSVPAVQTPVDVSTIKATGATQWTGLVVKKRFDRSSPRLLQAIIQREKLGRAEVRFYRVGGEQLLLIRSWILDGGVFIIGLSSSGDSEEIEVQLQLWSCRITFRDHVSGRVGGADFCSGKSF